MHLKSTAAAEQRKKNYAPRWFFVLEGGGGKGESLLLSRVFAQCVCVCVCVLHVTIVCVLLLV